MFRKYLKFTTIISGVILLMALSFIAGCSLVPGIGSSSSQGSQSGISVIKEAWDIIQSDYVEPARLDNEKITQAAIKAMVESLDDPYSVYLTPELYRIESADLQGTFEGIGAVVGMKDEKIVIIAPIAGSPAERSGIRPGDIILEVDGQSTAGMTVLEIVTKIRGPKGTSVSLLVQHEDEAEPVTITIVRAEINQPSVSFEMKDDIAYIRLYQFAEKTDEELTPIIQTLSSRKAKGIILDLRDNPGGILNTCVDVASHFIANGDIVTVIDNKNNRTTIPVSRGKVTTDLPLVVLVNQYSASASEVLSGALQDHQRATIAGSKTFGKGSVNSLFPLKDGSGIYITIGRWLTPGGRLIEGHGIEPDVELTLEGEEAVEWAIEYLHKYGGLTDGLKRLLKQTSTP